MPLKNSRRLLQNICNMNVTNRDFNKELCTLAFPLALQSLLTALVSASDALMLGRLNQNAIAAVSLASQIAFVMSLFTGGLAGGASALISQYFGKGDTDGVKRFLTMAIRYSLIIGVIFFLAAFFMPTTLMSFFTDEEALINVGASYLKIVSFSYLFTALTMPYLVIMKIDGRVKESVAISAMTVIVDMTVDFFLIYGIGPVPALGADGSAYSTIAVEAIAFIWCKLSSHREGYIGTDFKYLFNFNKGYESDLWKIVLPMLASSLSWGLSITVHSFIIGHCGTDATAAYSVTNVAQQLTQCVTAGLATGSGIMIGKLLGDNQLDKAKAYGDRFWKIALLCGFFNIAVLCVIGPAVYFFYVLSVTAKQYLIVMILYSMLYMFAYSFNTIFTCGVFPAGGDAMYDAVSVGVATWLIALPLSLLGKFVFDWPVIPVYMVMCMDEIIKVPVLFLYSKKYIWLKNLTR